MLSKSNILVLIQFMLFGAIALALVLLPRVSSGALQLIGVLMTFLGIVVALLAIREHAVANKNLPKVSPEPNAQVSLICSGLYSRVRHPIYTGVILSAFGATIAHGHLLGLIFAAALWGLLEYKSRHEEALLQQIYNEYGDYMRATGRFLPGLG